jgi:ABC-2 type transport system ATP-binding protein
MNAADEAMPAGHVVRVDGASKRYGVDWALRDVSMCLGAGEIVCLVGGNGAGKSTLIDLMLGFTRPDGGTIEVLGVDPLSEPARARSGVAYVPEQVALYPALSGLANLEYFLALSRRAIPRDILAGHLLDAGLPPEALNRSTSGYSKGMRQKVALVLAKLRQARLWLMDEPTSGLDPQSTAGLNAMLRGLRSEGGTALVSTHDMDQARDVADRVVLLQRGQVEAVMDRDAFSAHLARREAAEPRARE